MNKSPRQMTAKYDGVCHNCGMYVEAGEPMTWISKGIIECNDCNPIKPADSAPQTPHKAPKAKTWDKAFTWDETPPQINTRTPKPDNKPIVKPVAKPVAEALDPFLTVDPHAQTVIDLLVSLVNAANRLTADQCATVRDFATDQKENGSSESRRILFAYAARAIGQIN